MDYQIKIRNQDIKIPQEIVAAASGDELVARIFYNRGFKNPDTISQMLHEQYYIPTEPIEFPDIQIAVELIIKAIEDKDLIAVYGDYDVDGVTSTALLLECLGDFTKSLIYHVPDRFTEGYGMNENVIRAFADKGVSLIITCDCGIANTNEIGLAKALGMKVIVTDHHNIPDILPKADAILNPKLLGLGHRAINLSGCGMAYFLSLALLKHLNLAERAEGYLDILGLSLIADVVSLNGENRFLLKRAIPKLFDTKRTGLKELIKITEQSGKLKTEEDIAFQIAPRINAAGRMDSARIPVELLLTKNLPEAGKMAEKIDFLNKERKRVQQEIVEEAFRQVEAKKKNKTVLVLFSEFWHHGIIGIAAGKVCETYRKPAILLTLKEDGHTVVGSARSIEEIDIYNMIKECSGFLLKFGGHSQAAGLSLKKEDVEAFTEEIERFAETKYFIKDKVSIEVDAELELNLVDEKLYERLAKAGPFGEGFEAPLFLTRQVTVASDRKTERNHHIMVLAGRDGSCLPAVKWSGAKENLQGKVCDIVYKIGWNSYKGKSELQLTLEHMLETGRNSALKFEGHFIDERKNEIGTVLEHYQNSIVFYEGLSSACHLQNVYARKNLPASKERVQNLVFLSNPVNTGLFREIVMLVNPENVIINFSILPDYTFNGFVKNCLSVLKHIIINLGGREYIENISIHLCIEENIVIAALKYFRAAGKIDFEFDDETDSVLIYKSDTDRLSKLHEAEKNLKNALSEKYAYQQFVLKLEADRFGEYLK